MSVLERTETFMTILGCWTRDRSPSFQEVLLARSRPGVEHRQRRRDCHLPQPAYARLQQRLAQFGKHVQGRLRHCPGLHGLQDLDRLLRPDPTRDALPARLVPEE